MTVSELYIEGFDKIVVELNFAVLIKFAICYEIVVRLIKSFVL